MINKNITKSLSIVILVSGMAMLLLSCGSSKHDIAISTEDINIPDMQVEDFQVTYSDSAKVVFQLTAPLMLHFNDVDGESYNEFPDGFLIKKYDEEGNTIEHISADYGKDMERKSIMDARGNVIIVNITGDSIYTEHLLYFRKKEMLKSDVDVRIVQKDRVIVGSGMESDTDFKKRVIYDARIEQWIESEPKSEIKSEPKSETMNQQEAL